MCLLYGNISKFSYPGVILPAAAGLMFMTYTENVGDDETVARLGLLHAVSTSVLYFLYSSLMVFEIMRVSLSLVVQYSKSRLVYNSTVAINIASRKK